MKRYFKSIQKTILLITVLISSVYATAQWTNINSLSDARYEDISFPSEQTGYSIVQTGFANGIYKTADAGISWQQLTVDVSPINGPEFQSIHFFDDDNGYILFRGQNAQSQLTSYVFKSIDGGANWTDVTPSTLPVGTGYADVHFVSNLEGYATAGELLFKTIDGGANWTSDTNIIPIYPIEIDFFDVNNGIIGAADGTFAYKGIILNTTNAGQDWDTLFLPQTYTTIISVDYASSTVAYALSEGQWGEQKLYKTIDNCATWDSIVLNFITDSSDRAMDMFFIDRNNGYLSTSKGYIYKTDNGGNTWSIDHFEGEFLSVIATNTSSLFVGGSDTVLLTYSLLPPDGLESKDSFNQLEFYPNPANGNSIITFNQPLNENITITNVQGAIVFEERFVNQNTLSLVNLSLEKGLYLLRTEDNQTLKLIVN